LLLNYVSATLGEKEPPDIDISQVQVSSHGNTQSVNFRWKVGEDVTCLAIQEM
jgi:hypothetical protein